VKRIRWIPEMRVSSLLPGVAVLVQLAGGADAADDSVKEKASLCTSCHGERGVSQIENTPSLAGQPDLFLQWQLVAAPGKMR
jgi:cytochrome c553